MIEKGSINLGLVASIVIGLLIGYLLIALTGRLTRPAPTASVPPVTPPTPEPIGFKTDPDPEETKPAGGPVDDPDNGSGSV